MGAVSLLLAITFRLYFMYFIAQKDIKSTTHLLHSIMSIGKIHYLLPLIFHILVFNDLPTALVKQLGRT